MTTTAQRLARLLLSDYEKLEDECRNAVLMMLGSAIGEIERLASENQRLRSELYWVRSEQSDPHQYDGGFSEN